MIGIQLSIIDIQLHHNCILERLEPLNLQFQLEINKWKWIKKEINKYIILIK